MTENDKEEEQEQECDLEKTANPITWFGKQWYLYIPQFDHLGHDKASKYFNIFIYFLMDILHKSRFCMCCHGLNHYIKDKNKNLIFL